MCTSIRVLLAVLAFVAVPVFAQDGSLDLSFGLDGRVITDRDGGDDGAYALIYQPDGKLVIAGHTSPAPVFDARNFTLVRYDAHGIPDPSFGSGGFAITLPGGDEYGVQSAARALVLQPDGKLVAAGYTDYTSTQAVLARYTPGGTLDPTFGTEGLVLGPAGTTANDLVLQPDGKLVMLGTDLRRYHADGSPDLTFGTDGIVTTGFAGDALVLQPDGKLVAGGSKLVRLDATGTPDLTFGSDGGVDLGFVAQDLARQPDGKLVAVGTVPLGPNACESGPCTGMMLARLLPDGRLDSAFGQGGTTTTQFGIGSSGANTLVIQPDGKIIAAGFGTPEYLPDVFALARYLSDGRLDASFGQNGIVTTRFWRGEQVHALALQSDGNVVAAGRSYARFGVDYDIVLARYYSDGQPLPDPTPPVCGPITFARNGPNGAISDVYTSVSDTQSGIARIAFTSLANFVVSLDDSPFTDQQGDVYLAPEPAPYTLAIRASRISYTLGARLVTTVSNGAGLTARCDPVVRQLDAAVPPTFEVEAPYPSPVHAGETVHLAVALVEPASVRIAVYDLLGREVLRLLDTAMEPARYALEWDGTDLAGRPLAAGTYLYRVTAGSFVETHRIAILH